MRESKLEKYENEFTEIDSYKGYTVYAYKSVDKSSIATMIPNSNNIPVAITINPEAYEILKTRPDFLERIYEHEIIENTTEKDVEHGQDNDILRFLKDSGYDFGNFKFDE